MAPLWFLLHCHDIDIILGKLGFMVSCGEPASQMDLWIPHHKWKPDKETASQMEAW